MLPGFGPIFRVNPKLRGCRFGVEYKARFEGQDRPPYQDERNFHPHRRHASRGAPGILQPEFGTLPDTLSRSSKRFPALFAKSVLHSIVIVEFDLKFLPVPVTAYSQTSTLRSR